MKKSFKVLSLALCAVFFIQLFLPLKSNAAVTQSELMSEAKKIIEYKMKEIDATASGKLLSGSLLDAAGTTAADWYALSLSRLQIEDDFITFLAVLKKNIEDRIKKDGNLGIKATEYHRVSLCIAACGENPQCFINGSNSKTVNLINDGIFYCKTINRQGINGSIWGLITLNACNASEPKDAVNTTNSLINDILFAQQSDGGWAQSQATQTDITAMALIALSPFYNKNNNKVDTAVNRALLFLQTQQANSGAFTLDGVQTAESTAQVITALCSLGINPQEDARFIKNGFTAVNGLLSFCLKSGGATHSNELDKNNTSLVPGVANSMAGEQVLYAIAALCRLYDGKCALFDFSDAASYNADFTTECINDTFSLPLQPDTSYRSHILSLIYRAQKTEFKQKDVCLNRLNDLYNSIENTNKTIDTINDAIKTPLFLQDDIKIKNTYEVNRILSLYKSLSEYDRQKIEAQNELLRAQTRLNSLWRSIVIFAVVLIFAAFGIAVIFVRAKKRKKLKNLVFYENSINGDD